MISAFIHASVLFTLRGVIAALPALIHGRLLLHAQGVLALNRTILPIQTVC